MEALIKSKKSCRLLRIDIDSWGSEVAKQHGIRSIPALWLYDGQHRVSTDAREVLSRIGRLD